SSLEDMVDQIPTIGDFAPIDVDDLTTSFTAYILLMLALGPVGLIVAGVPRLRTEEQAGRPAGLLGAGAGRGAPAARRAGGQAGRLAGLLIAGTGRVSLTLRWIAVVAFEVCAAQVLLGLGTGIGVWAATGESSWIGETLLASLVYLPAIAVTGALTLALYGLRVRLAGLAWLVVIWAALDTFLGDLLQLPDWARALSVLHHVPFVPGDDVEAMPLVITGAAAVLLTVLGLLSLRRRDLAAG